MEWKFVKTKTNLCLIISSSLDTRLMRESNTSFKKTKEVERFYLINNKRCITKDGIFLKQN